MGRSKRRLAILIGTLVALLVGSALLYQAGMSHLEGKPRDFWSSLEWAGETLSTTGYGADSRWGHPAMVLFVVAVQFVGVFLVFLVVPIYLIPFLEERFEGKLPTEGPKISGHVVVFHSGAATETLIADLAAAEVTPVVVEPDSQRARRLLERRLSVVSGSIADGVLARVHLGRARALVLNAGDDENALAALVARQSGFSGDVIALVEDPVHRKPLQLAGASRVFTPRHALGAALAARASRRVHPSVAGLGALGKRLHVAELRVAAASPLAGMTLAEASVGNRFGVTILGLWEHGKLSTEAHAATRLEPGSIVIAAGDNEPLAAFSEAVTAVDQTGRRGRFVIAGLGEVGAVARRILETVDEQVVTVDSNPSSGADVVGDFLDPAVLEQLDLANASAVILALDQDAATLFAALVVRDLAPNVPIIARVNEAANVERIHVAGADFALSISQVAGQILAHRILDEEAISVEPGLRVRGIGTAKLVGRAIADLDLRARTGCSVVAIERGDELLVRLDTSAQIIDGDRLYICGAPQAVREAAARLEPRPS